MSFIGSLGLDKKSLSFLDPPTHPYKLVVIQETSRNKHVGGDFDFETSTRKSVVLLHFLHLPLSKIMAG